MKLAGPQKKQVTIRRLVHSGAGAIRAAQLTAAELIVYVEGWPDRAFYGNVCRASGVQAPTSVRASQELLGNRSGKSALITHYRYLRKARKLVDRSFGKVTLHLFFLDKDIDDMRHSSARSPHVEYTRHYSFENYLFRTPKLVEAIAATLQLDPGHVEANLGSNWVQHVAVEWKPWVEHCVFLRLKNLNCQGYGSSHGMHVDGTMQIDNAKVLRRHSEAEHASGLSRPDFIYEYKKVRSRVNRLYAKGEWDRALNGKWYGRILEADAARIAGGKHANKNGVHERVVTCLMAMFDYTCADASHLADAVRRVAALR